LAPHHALDRTHAVCPHRARHPAKVIDTLFPENTARISLTPYNFPSNPKKWVIIPPLLRKLTRCLAAAYTSRRQMGEFVFPLEIACAFVRRNPPLSHD
jgi:hypothetical protein